MSELLVTPALPVMAVPLIAISFPVIRGTTVATGNLDIYTCPAGRRAIFSGIVVFGNSAGSIVWYPELKSGGNYYRMNGDTNTSAGTTSQALASQFVLEAGDSLAINTTTNTGLNYSAEVIEFDNKSLLVQGRLLGLSTGDNTLYTCPTGKNAYTVGASPAGFTSTTTVISFTADSGGTRTFTINLVPNGGSPTNSNKSGSIAVGANSHTIQNLGIFAMTAGDFINVNVNTGNAAEFAGIMVVEI